MAIVGSLFASVYSSQLASSLAGAPIPADAAAVARESVGAAYAVAEQAPAPFGDALRDAASSAFMDGFSAGSLVAAGVVLSGAMLAWLFLPARAAELDDEREDAAAVGPAELSFEPAAV